MPAGDQLGGQWEWASPSPDGRWVLAGWSAECEVVTNMFVSVADASVRTVTGEAGAGDASRRLLLPLTPSQSVLRWDTVDDRRTRR